MSIDNAESHSNARSTVGLLAELLGVMDEESL